MRIKGRPARLPPLHGQLRHRRARDADEERAPTARSISAATRLGADASPEDAFSISETGRTREFRNALTALSGSSESRSTGAGLLRASSAAKTRESSASDGGQNLGRLAHNEPKSPSRTCTAS